MGQVLSRQQCCAIFWKDKVVVIAESFFYPVELPDINIIMGLTTSRPLLDAEIPGDEHINDNDEEQEVEESCWRYFMRKLYSLFGYESLSFNDVSRSQRKRLRGDDEDVERQQNKIPRLSTNDSLSTSVSVHEEDETPEKLSKINKQQLTDDKVPPPHLDNSSNIITPPEQSTEEQYLDFSFLDDSHTVEYLRHSRTMFVMRGLPGSGKSTLVRKMKSVYPGAVVCSADQFFISDEGVYQFDR